MNHISGYGELADEYYEPRHVTSRNFEAATLNWTSVNGCPIPDSGFVLDIGSGRGSAATFCQVQPTRIIQGDIAMPMLALSPRPPSMGRVVCDAKLLPFASGSFTAVTAFLFDPFNSAPFLSESFRVLAHEGVFLGTLPHRHWGTALRRLRGAPPDVARFFTRSGKHVDKPSYLLNESELRLSLAANGYRVVELHVLTLPRTEATVSPDISDPARADGVSPYELPILQLVVARKS